MARYVFDQAAYYLSNRAAIRQKQAAYYRANKEKCLARNSEWAACHREAVRVYQFQYRLEHKKNKRVYDARRFQVFKKELKARIALLSKSPKAQHPTLIQSIYDWAGSSHSFWVESEIDNAVTS